MVNQTISEERKGIPQVTTVASGLDLNRLRIPIRAKITLPYLLLAVALALGAAYVVTQIVFDTVEERFTNQLIEAGKLASEWMVREEDARLESLRLLVHAEGVAGAIEAKDAEKLRQLTYGIAVDHQEEAVEFLDREGNLLMAMRRRIGSDLIEDYDFSKEGDGFYLQWDFVNNIYLRKVDSQGDKYSGYIQADWGDYFYVSGPIFDQAGDFAGVVLVGKSLKTMTKQIRQETLSQITLYDLEGEPLSSTFFNPEPLIFTSVSDILKNQDESSFSRNLDNRRDLDVANISYQEIFAPWEARGGGDLGVMGISLAKTFLVTASRVTKIQIIVLVAFAFVVVALLGVNLANYITRPLLSLVSASKEVSQGNLQIQVDSKSNDEVAELAQSFNQMVSSLYESKMDLVQAYDSTLEGWSKALELRDEGTEGHTKRVTEMTLRLALAIGIDRERMANVRRGALLHDIGKMGVPDSILLKKGSLTDDEWRIMKRHPSYAYEMLWPIEYLRPSLEIPYCHHERWDGTGYPRGLKGEDIPLSARIFAVVDVWDALRTDRPYREALPDEEVIEHIKAGSGSHFDPNVVAVFVEIVNKSE